MSYRNPFLSDGWKKIPLISREVRLEADGTPWTGPCDPVMRERIREVYRKLCESGETGRQIVAVNQEISADLQALIEKKRRHAKGRKAKRSQTG